MFTAPAKKLAYHDKKNYICISNQFKTNTMQNFNIPPLKFQPILKSVIWGGEKIVPFKGIETDQTKIGESWEISGVPSNPSVIANGPDKGKTLPEILKVYREALVGAPVYKQYGDTFPLLIKIIDAAGDLSLQVHPDDELARKRHNSLGKTEMWYIVDTDEDATICAGLKESITPEQYEKMVADNTLINVVAHNKSHPGDVFFLPAGRIHAIGAGNLLVEVQETSDVTYRIYDYGRVDAKTGKTRELHVEQAKDAIDYKVYPDYQSQAVPEIDGISELVNCDHFSVYRLDIDGTKVFNPVVDTFTTLTCIEGEVTVVDDRGNEVSIHRGESALIPAMAKTFTLKGKGTLIDACIC